MTEADPLERVERAATETLKMLGEATPLIDVDRPVPDRVALASEVEFPEIVALGEAEIVTETLIPFALTCPLWVYDFDFDSVPEADQSQLLK